MVTSSLNASDFDIESFTLLDLVPSKILRDHSFSTYAKFSEKHTFVTPDTHTYVWGSVSGG